MKVYERIANLLIAIDNCENHGNWEWKARHESVLDSIIRNGPSGSGFDNGTKLADESTSERLVLVTAFHHMDEHGYYCGWTEHSVIVKASLAFGIRVIVTGRNRRGIKEYIGETFHNWLTENCTQ